MTSLNWIECALFVGLRLTRGRGRGRDRLAGVCDFPTIGDIQLWRPANGFIGDEIKYWASPGGPRISGEELWLRDEVDIVDSCEGSSGGTRAAKGVEERTTEECDDSEKV